MRILIIYPSVSVGGFNSYGNHSYGPAANNINHGIASIAASLKSQQFETLLLDCRRLSGFEELEDRIASLKPDAVALSGYSEDYLLVIQCINIINRVLPKCKVFVGGIHASLCPEDFLMNSMVDHVLMGEGEITFPAVLKTLALGKPVERLVKCEKPNLDEIPFADREIFDYTKELNYPWFGDKLKEYMSPPTVTVIAGRGCPYKCSFCQPSEKLLFGTKVRMRSVSNVMAELKMLYEAYHFKSIVFHDDCLLMFRRWSFEFADRFIDFGNEVSIFAAARADNICKNPDLFSRLKQVGLKVVNIGFESGNQRVLDFLKKETTVEQNLRAVEICREIGLGIFGNFMLGVPGETKEEAMDTVRLIRRINPEVKSINLFTPSVGSELYEYCIQNELIFVDVKHLHRSTPSIKGIDYEFLKHAVEKALDLHFAKRLIRLVLKSQRSRWLFEQTKRNPFLYSVASWCKLKFQAFGIIGSL